MFDVIQCRCFVDSSFVRKCWTVILVFQFFFMPILFVCLFLVFLYNFHSFASLSCVRCFFLFSFQSFSVHIGIVSLLYECCSRSSWSHWCFVAIDIQKYVFLDRIGIYTESGMFAMNAYLHCAHEWISDLVPPPPSVSLLLSQHKGFSSSVFNRFSTLFEAASFLSFSMWPYSCFLSFARLFHAPISFFCIVK